MRRAEHGGTEGHGLEQSRHGLVVGLVDLSGLSNLNDSIIWSLMMNEQFQPEKPATACGGMLLVAWSAVTGVSGPGSVQG